MSEDGIIPEDQLDKVGDKAGKLLLIRALADVIYAARVNLPPSQVGKKMEKFFEVLDGYIDWRISGAMERMLKDVLAEIQYTERNKL